MSLRDSQWADRPGRFGRGFVTVVRTAETSRHLGISAKLMLSWANACRDLLGAGSRSRQAAMISADPAWLVAEMPRWCRDLGTDLGKLFVQVNTGTGPVCRDAEMFQQISGLSPGVAQRETRPGCRVRASRPGSRTHHANGRSAR